MSITLGKMRENCASAVSCPSFTVRAIFFMTLKNSFHECSGVVSSANSLGWEHVSRYKTREVALNVEMALLRRPIKNVWNGWRSQENWHPYWQKNFQLPHSLLKFDMYDFCTRYAAPNLWTPSNLLFLQSACLRFLKLYSANCEVAENRPENQKITFNSLKNIPYSQDESKPTRAFVCSKNWSSGWIFVVYCFRSVDT